MALSLSCHKQPVIKQHSNCDPHTYSLTELPLESTRIFGPQEAQATYADFVLKYVNSLVCLTNIITTNLKVLE